VAEVLAQARPLGQMLWTRETEAGSLDTPERRAAFEARLAHVIAAIGDDSVRKYYRSEFGDRLRRLFEGDERGRVRRQPGRSGSRAGAAWAPNRHGAAWMPNRHDANRARPAGNYARAGSRWITYEPYIAASPQLASSPVHRGHRAAIPRREALILQAVINYPWLLHDHLEALAGVELRHSEAAKVKAALIDIFAHGCATDAEGMRSELERRGLTEVAARIQKAITTSSVWGAAGGAAPDDVLMTWKQLVALHRQWHSLVKELRDAECALGQETTEANYSWLQDVKARLSVLDGTEALIEGFGTSSGRPVRSL
jgi:DNA primase